MAIIDASTYKAIVGITVSTYDTQLTHLTDHVDRLIKEYCGCDIEATTYPAAQSGNSLGDHGYYSGDGTRYLLMRHRPVWNNSNLLVYQSTSGRFGDNPDETFPAAANLLTEGTDYVLRTDGRDGTTGVSVAGILERINGVWPALAVYERGRLTWDHQPQRGNIYVAYKAGYSTVPKSIVNAAAFWVSHMRRTILRGGNMTSESLGAYSYQMSPILTGMPDEVKLALSKYRNRPL